MARNAIESYLRTSKMDASGHFVKNLKKKYRIMARNAIESEFRKKFLYRSEMARIAIEIEFRKSKTADRSEMARLKVNFGHPKWPPAAILSNISKKFKVAYQTEMARNAIESEIRTSKMADVSHFVKNFQKQLSCVSM